ncbi:MAG: CarD family transcriptional regulator [Clostridium sp.]|nr:CarD family transcriptional regulator [Clostridium sp.]
MFKINDYIVYGDNGICKVVDIGVPSVSCSKDKVYYTLEPVYESGKIFTPVDNDRIVMRNLIKKEDAEKLIASINSMEPYWIDDYREREMKFKEVIKSCDCSQEVLLIKSVLERKEACKSTGRKLSQNDDKFLKRAKEKIVTEFSIAFDMPSEMVDKYIKDSVKSVS